MAEKKTNGRRNRNAGHAWEREGVKDFALFYPKVQTSRNVNHARDAAKVDLAYADEYKDGRFPYNCQYKSYSTALRYYQLLSEMPSDDGIPNVVMHKQTERVKSKFVTRDKFAIMYYDDFFKFVAYRRGFEIMIKYWDALTKEDQELVSTQLKEIGL